MIKGGDMVTFDSIIILARKLLDVLLVWLLIYYALKHIRKKCKNGSFV